MTNTRLTKVINHPYHQYLGLTDFTTENGLGRLRLVVTEKLINPAGALHGGVVYAVLDVVAYTALCSQLADDQEAATHDIHVSVMRPTMLGDVLEFTAKVEKLGWRLAFLTATAEVGGKTVATARITKSIL